MGEFVAYSVKVALCLVMFYVFYKLLLSRTTFHTFNRCVILSLVAISLLLPFVHITLEQSNTLVENVTVEPLLAMITETESATFTFSMIHLAIIIYFTGVIVCALRMIISYFHIYRMFRSASQVVSEGDIRIYIHSNDVSPFSWFRNVVISESDYTCSGRQAIITHEKAHAMRGHSADILLCNLLTVVQWFNPAAWLLKAEMQDVHEYEADESVLKSGIDATGYQLLLVRKAVGSQLFAIANNLSKDSLKKRIKMMKTKRTNRWECVKALVMLPLSVIAVVAFASQQVSEVELKVVSDTEQLVDAVKSNVMPDKLQANAGAPLVSDGDATFTDVPDEQVSVALDAEQPLLEDTVKMKELTVISYGTVKKGGDDESKAALSVAEVMPEYPGGMKEMMGFLSANIVYPKDAEKKGEQGRVIVSFVVEKDGSITHAKVVKSVSPSLDAEALRVVGKMPKWTPGKNKGEDVAVNFVMPVSFKLDNSTDKYINPASGLKGNPLVLVDGKKIGEATYKTLNDINPSDIENITVLKGEEAIKQYGDEGKEGVILVKLKSK